MNIWDMCIKLCTPPKPKPSKDDYKSVFRNPDALMLIICVTEILMLTFYIQQQLSYNALITKMWENSCFTDMFYPEGYVSPSDIVEKNMKNVTTALDISILPD